MIFFIAESEEILSSPPWGFLIGIYLFYEHWPAETFREIGWRRGFVLALTQGKDKKVFSAIV